MQPQPIPTPIPAPARRSGPGLLVTVVIAVVALLVGAGAAFSGLLLTGWRQQPERHYTVVVFFKTDVTAAQQDAARAVLAKIPATGGVRLETSEEAYAKFKEAFKDQPQLVGTMTADAMPQSFWLSTASRKDFDCTLVHPLGGTPGVDQYIVTQSPRDGHPGAKVGC